MKNYKPHIFYKVEKLSLEKKREIINYAKEVCYEWWVDKLDCNERFARQKTEMRYQDIMKKLDNRAHFTVIHRRGFDFEPWRGEIGFRTMGPTPDWFLWINVTEDNLKNIIEKFNLKPN